MAEFKWIKMSLFLIAVLQFTAAERLPLSFTVRVGDEVTLPCENVIDGQQKCNSTTWLFVGSGYTAVVELVRLGQIGENAKAKSDRLSVTASCSLVIKKVTVEDVGYYTCRQFRSGQHQDAHVHLFLITMTEHKDPDKVTLTCSVLTSGQCGHTVKWLYEGKDVAEGNKDMETSQTDCYASVSFLDSHFIYTSRSKLKCEVTDTYSGKVQQFPFSSQSAGEKPGDKQTATTKSSRTIEYGTKSVTTTTAINDTSTKLQDWWRFSIVSAGLAALIIIVVAVNMWTRTKGKKTQMDENTEVNHVIATNAPRDWTQCERETQYES
ncbi:uncharacterized protein LOC122863066 isoform X1 [Siniperca chuatsi]|uniref:uncharacterized protein LOC122863066 isoform X1 n=1 Tax=Siniperca chuatsi TaxID=119488 RepID=UPI001CE09A68|nr:uncharacterized protein LOC122863066 isoform X1 [Siniperca chuatsi]